MNGIAFAGFLFSPGNNISPRISSIKETTLPQHFAYKKHDLVEKKEAWLLSKDDCVPYPKFQDAGMIMSVYKKRASDGYRRPVLTSETTKRKKLSNMLIYKFLNDSGGSMDDGQTGYILRRRCISACRPVAHAYREIPPSKNNELIIGC